jgi:hypothetical protein
VSDKGSSADMKRTRSQFLINDSNTAEGGSSTSRYGACKHGLVASVARTFIDARNLGDGGVFTIM